MTSATPASVLPEAIQKTVYKPEEEGKKGNVKEQKGFFFRLCSNL